MNDFIANEGPIFVNASPSWLLMPHRYRNTPLVVWTPDGWRDFRIHFYFNEFSDGMINVSLIKIEGGRARVSVSMLTDVLAEEVADKVKNEFIALKEGRANLSAIEGVLEQPTPVISNELSAFLNERLKISESRCLQPLRDDLVQISD
ncbi:hypothetical protein ASD74_04255 [Rhizobium sp. Root564]|nr:hypothetical protein ASD74_04255 [Rhizobium sp. Root564]